MYTKQDAARIKQQFWTAFGQYMAPVPSYLDGDVNWLNYRTGVKSIRFRMETESDYALVAICIVQKDEVLRRLYYDQLYALRKILHEFLLEEWKWEPEFTDKLGTVDSRVYIRQPGLNIFKQEDWPEIIRFFKTRMIALDAFWSTVKDSFSEM